MLSRLERENCYEESDTSKARKESIRNLTITDPLDPHLHHSWECSDCLKSPPPGLHDDLRLTEAELIISKQLTRNPEDPKLTLAYYLVKWKDYEVKEASWEPYHNLVFGDSDCLPLVQEFESRPAPEVYPKIRVYERDLHKPTSYTCGSSYNSATGWSLQKRFARRAYVPKFPNYERTFAKGDDKLEHTYVGESGCTRVSQYHDVRYPYGTHTDTEPSYRYPNYPLSLKAAPQTRGPKTRGSSP